MPCKLNAKLLNENLEVIDNVKVRFEPKTQSVSFFDEELANSMFKIESTNIVFMNKNLNVDISTYIYINKLLYKIIKLNIYDTYLECLVYQCNNIPVNINDVFDKDNILPKNQLLNINNDRDTPSTFSSIKRKRRNNEIIPIPYKVKHRGDYLDV